MTWTRGTAASGVNTVSAGVGVGIVPETTARQAARTMPLAVLPLRDPWAVRDLHPCTRDPHGLSACARDLAAHLAGPGTAP